jgi:hypothetical protein
MTNEIEPVEGKSSESRHSVPPAPIHPLAALTTIVLDNVFGVIEIVDPLAIALTSLTVGGVGFLSTLFIQRYLAKDDWGASAAKGLVMGVLAGVPFQVTGTAVGAILLGWAGASKWIKLPQREPPGSELGPGEIVDVQPKEEK